MKLLGTAISPTRLVLKRVSIVFDVTFTDAIEINESNIQHNTLATRYGRRDASRKLKVKTKRVML